MCRSVNFHNKRMVSSINKLLDDIFKERSNLCTEYNITNSSITVYSLLALLHGSVSLNKVSDGVMSCHYDIHRDDGLITKIDTEILLSYEELFENIIECELDFEKARKYFCFVLRHEIGHIISYNKFIGKKFSEFIEVFDNKHKLKNPRRNASLESLIKWQLEYMHLPIEKLANECVGITDEMIVESIRLISGK